MNAHKRFSVAAVATLAALAGQPALADEAAVKAQTTPQSEVTIGGAYLFPDDSARFAKFNGMTDDTGYLLFDGNMLRRDDETGTWLRLSGRNLGLDDREARFEYERQGNWNFFVEGGQFVLDNPLTIKSGLVGIGNDRQYVTGVPVRDIDLEFGRDRVKAGFGKKLGDGFDTSVSYRYEHKNGARQWGSQGFQFVTEPLDWESQEVDAKINYTGERLQMSGGYLGSFFGNENRVLRTDGSRGTLALPLDNQANQLYMTGGYSFTPATRGTFKASYGVYTQDAPFFQQADLAKANHLGGLVYNTLLQAGLSSRPMTDLSVRANLRYEGRDDATTQRGYVTASTTRPGTNVPFDRQTTTGDLEATYRLPMEFTLVGGLQEEYWHRGSPIRRSVGYRDDTYETTGRVELRRRLTETLGGGLAYLKSHRGGSAYIRQSSGNDYVDPINWADRDRDKGRLTVDWAATDKLSFQARTELSQDIYNDRELGPGRGYSSLYALDGSYEFIQDWNLTGWGSYGNTSMHQSSRGTGNDSSGNATGVSNWESDLSHRTWAFGMGVDGKPIKDVKVKADLQYAVDRSEQHIRSLQLFDLVDLPGIEYREINFKFTTDYALWQNAGLRFFYNFIYLTANDWTWQIWTYADGSYLEIPSAETTNIFGVMYYMNW